MQAEAHRAYGDMPKSAGIGKAYSGVSSSLLMGSSKGLLTEERKELLPYQQEERAVSFNLGEALLPENRPLLRGNGLINE